jgi:hypothetical protein
MLHSKARTQVWMAVTCDVITELAYRSLLQMAVLMVVRTSEVMLVLHLITPFEFEMEAQHLTIH